MLAPTATGSDAAPIQDAPGREHAYAGIGSRFKTPQISLRYMGLLARKLAGMDYTLRSGGSGQSDMAFEAGAEAAGGNTEIFLPWRGFDKRTVGTPAQELPIYTDCLRIAADHHPAWGSLRDSDRKLHARNVPIILGRTLINPSRFVVCWGKNPRLDGQGRVMDCDGGTGLGVRVAYSHGVPVFHLGIQEHARRILTFCGDDALLM